MPSVEARVSSEVTPRAPLRVADGGAAAGRSVRVLHLIDTLEIGGAERSLLDILSRFRDVSPVMCHLYPGAALRPLYEQAGIPVLSLDIAGRYGFAAAARRVRALLATARPDVVHSTLFRADIVARLALLGSDIPLVSSFVNDSYSPLRFARLDRVTRAKLRVSQLLDAVTARRVDFFTANSDTIKRSNARALGLDASRIEVIYRGRDPRRYTTMGQAERAAKREQMGIARSTKVILNTSRLLERKGLVELVEAYRRCRTELGETLLLQAGDGPFRATLEQAIAAAGLGDSVRLLGTRQDVPELLQIADLFVFPSHFEGLPGSLVEAMMASVPVVASDISVHREMLVDGRTARLFPVGDVDALGRGMVSALADPETAREMATGANARARELFDIESVARQHERLYARLVRKRRHGRESTNQEREAGLPVAQPTQ